MKNIKITDEWAVSNYTHTVLNEVFHTKCPGRIGNSFVWFNKCSCCGKEVPEEIKFAIKIMEL